LFHGEAVLLQPIEQGAARKTQEPRGTRAIPAGRVQREDKKRALDRLEINTRRWHADDGTAASVGPSNGH
jgi:hypothetical protein